MQTPEPTCLMEQLFIASGAKALPIGDAEIGRNDWGILNCFWKSPCHAIEGLWVPVKECEIMLSTKVFHTHVDKTNFLSEDLPDSELPKRIVAEAISKTLAILSGEVIFTESRYQDGSGNEGFCFGMSPRHVWEDRNLSGYNVWEGTVERAWNWMGEVPIR